MEIVILIIIIFGAASLACHLITWEFIRAQKKLNITFYKLIAHQTEANKAVTQYINAAHERFAEIEKRLNNAGTKIIELDNAISFDKEDLN